MKCAMAQKDGHMAIYILLILYLLALPVVFVYLIPDRKKRERVILRLGMAAIFLLLALKKETVGIDIAGYKQQYLLSAAMPWANTDYVYFEPGYIQLMKLFSKAGLDFQVFAAAIYAVCCGAYDRFIHRYSENVTLSMLMFVCYQSLVFYTSGLRQALAMAICIDAFLVLDGNWGKDWQRFCCAVMLVLAASSIHLSALVFLAVIVMVQWKPERLHWMVMMLCFAVSVALRPMLLRLINIFIGTVDLESSITLGGNFVFLVGLMLFSVVGYYQRNWHGDAARNRFVPISTNILMMAVIAQILFSSSSLLRSSMYLTLFLIPGLPCALKCYERRIELLLTWFLVLFLIVLFWTDTLSINQLKLLPYRFFWQQ